MTQKGGQISTKKEDNVEKLMNPWASSPRLWSRIFLASCVVGVSIDPLFLYILVIDKDRKCLSIDHNMKYAALVLRSITDLFYVIHIIFRLHNALAVAKELNLSLFPDLPWWLLLVDVLAVLPLPQVIVLRCFTKLAGSRHLITRKMLNVLLLLQYVPRALRVYLSAKDVGRSFDLLTKRVWVKGAFFFFLYIIFGHIIGALWYFYAIFRETACWHKACLSFSGCEPSHFDCRLPNTMKNTTYLNAFCPVDPPNAAVYDYGIFSEAIESGILTSRGFLQKFSRCFWWGLRNLSSFGQNLETSANILENFFAVLISILGLLSFLYLIGNLQTYMQLATTNAEDGRRKIDKKKHDIDSFLSSHSLSHHKTKVIKRYLQRMIKEEKDFDIKHLYSLVEELPVHHQNNPKAFKSWLESISDLKKHGGSTSALRVDVWISKYDFTAAMKQSIMQYIELRLQEGKDIDVGSILPILPSELNMSVKKLLCFPTLRKVPLLQNMDEVVYETMCEYLKPMVYAENSYIIRKEEPLDFILLVTHGVVWCFGSRAVPKKRLQRGDFYGEELLEWQLNSASYDRFPISEANLKCHTKVEAFALMAVDLTNVLFACWGKFCKPGEPIPEGLKPFAATVLQHGFTRFWCNRKAKLNQRLAVVTQT